MVVQDVACGVVLEALIVGRVLLGWVGRLARTKELAHGVFYAPGGVVLVGDVSTQTVAALAQLAHLVVGVGFHQAVEGVLLGCACAEHCALPVGVAGLVGLAALV